MSQSKPLTASMFSFRPEIFMMDPFFYFWGVGVSSKFKPEERVAIYIHVMKGTQHDASP